MQCLHSHLLTHGSRKVPTTPKSAGSDTAMPYWCNTSHTELPTRRDGRKIHEMILLGTNTNTSPMFGTGSVGSRDQSPRHSCFYECGLILKNFLQKKSFRASFGRSCLVSTVDSVVMCSRVASKTVCERLPSTVIIATQIVSYLTEMKLWVWAYLSWLLLRPFLFFRM